MSNGFSLRSLSVSWPARSSFMLCFIVLLLLAPLSFASEQSSLMDSLQTHLQTTLVQLTDLETKLATWKLLSAESEQQVQVLSLELVQLRGELEALQMFSADSQKRVEELRKSLEASEEKLTQVSKILRDSADSWKAVADAERQVVRRWKFGAILAAAGALLVGGAAGWLLTR